MTTMEMLTEARVALDSANRRAAKLLEGKPTIRMRAPEREVWIALTAPRTSP